MKTTFNKNLLMTKGEIEELNSLPDNMPETKLTAKQTQLINELYYKYVTPLDDQNWGKALYEIEMSEKWPSGSRMKQIQAKRIVLNALAVVNENSKLKGLELTAFLHAALDCRESWQRIVKAAFVLNY